MQVAAPGADDPAGHNTADDHGGGAQGANDPAGQDAGDDRGGHGDDKGGHH